MKIRHISIRRFRGINELDWSLPDSHLFCLIGRGDTTKSTVLDAIRYTFHPQWNLSFDDSDFYLCQIAEPFTIDITVGDLPDEFLDIAKHGNHLRGWHINNRTLQDEPEEGLEEVITVRLKVGSDLEPSWHVINDRLDDGVRFSPSDRAKAAVSLIGSYADKHLTWGRSSILTQMTDSDSISMALATAGRAAKDALDGKRADDLTNFDEAAKKAEAAARELGVPIAQGYKAHLDVSAVNVKQGGLSLHDGDIPLRQLGLGSRRMLTCGLQKQALNQPHITLFDEVEFGLEPHRIARLLKQVKEDTTGQYFLTTHSPVVLRELTVTDLYVLHVIDGKTIVVPINQPEIADSLQGKIRSGAEAFLAKKILVCEGATEVGFCRGLDNHWISQDKSSLAYQGVACYDANGANKVKGIATELKTLGYDVAVLVDSDAPGEFSEVDANVLRERSVDVIKWDGDLSIEERIFSDIPYDYVLGCVDCAENMYGAGIIDHIQTQYGVGFDRNRNNWEDTTELRAAIGKAAKNSGWFKRQDKAEEWFDILKDLTDRPDLAQTDFVQKIMQLRTWVDNV